MTMEDPRSESELISIFRSLQDAIYPFKSLEDKIRDQDLRQEELEGRYREGLHEEERYLPPPIKAEEWYRRNPNQGFPNPEFLPRITPQRQLQGAPTGSFAQRDLLAFLLGELGLGHILQAQPPTRSARAQAPAPQWAPLGPHPDTTPMQSLLRGLLMGQPQATAQRHPPIVPQPEHPWLRLLGKDIGLYPPVLPTFPGPQPPAPFQAATPEGQQTR